LELGKRYTIHLPSIDNDGDVVRCLRARYIEALGFGRLLIDLETRKFLAIDRMKCVMEIEADPGYFKEGDTFGVPVTVKDYSKTIMSTQSKTFLPYINVIGRVVTLMSFKITGKTDPPEFIPPTPMNNMQYRIYVGGDFNVKVYAKASIGRKVARFDILRVDGKLAHHSGIQSATHISPAAAFISIRWSPQKKDVGHHIICVNAEDNQGRSTVDMQCFRIEIKENIFIPGSKPAVIANPTFVSFPEPNYLTCEMNTYCIFPVFVTTADAKGITSIISTRESEENVTIQYVGEPINGTINITGAQVEFLALHAGLRKICLKASDSNTFTHMCQFVTVKRHDPCASNPCQHGGRCLSFDCNVKFVCSCSHLFTGRFCEKRIKACDSNPCSSNAICIDNYFQQPYFICLTQNDQQSSTTDSLIGRIVG
ncbi:uncharacterized protein LOC134258624, partial [Saccostrea cucullata]|uniref:uncharacterized protein LOC134258624 n=1 Tax=Saccostrea cuccullata TaxID=36930 RepID=UPI002ED5C646